MAIIQQNSRIAHHRLSTTGSIFTVPSTTDFTDSSWLSTDLLVGELGINITDDRIFFRTTNGIIELTTSGGLGSMWDRVGDDVMLLEDTSSTPVVQPNLLPPTDDVSNIGSASNHWMHLYLSKDVHCSNVRINEATYQSTQITTPTIATTTQNGVTASAITAGASDTRGVITTTGTQNQTAYTKLTIAFQHGFTVTPSVIVSLTSNPGTGSIEIYVVPSTTGFEFYFLSIGATPPSADLSFNYLAIG